MPRQNRSLSPLPPAAPPRRWYADAALAFVFALLCFYLTRGAKPLGPLIALFVFVATGGTAWVYARSAWRGLTAGRAADARRG